VCLAECTTARAVASSREQISFPAALTGRRSIAPRLKVAGRVVDQDDLVKQAWTFVNLRCISTAA
jgi:hypothetical protein